MAEQNENVLSAENENLPPPEETEGDQGQGEAPKKKGKKKKEVWRELVESDEPKFKKIDFEHALTKEEKLAKRRAKKGGKEKKAKPPPEKKEETKQETTEQAPVSEEVTAEVLKEPEAKKEKKGKGKKDKKDKKKKDATDIDLDALDTKIPSLSDLPAPTEAPVEGKKKKKKGEKEKKKKEKVTPVEKTTTEPSTEIEEAETAEVPKDDKKGKKKARKEKSPSKVEVQTSSTDKVKKKGKKKDKKKSLEKTASEEEGETSEEPKEKKKKGEKKKEKKPKKKETSKVSSLAIITPKASSLSKSSITAKPSQISHKSIKSIPSIDRKQEEIEESISSEESETSISSSEKKAAKQKVTKKGKKGKGKKVKISKVKLTEGEPTEEEKTDGETQVETPILPEIKPEEAKPKEEKSKKGKKGKKKKEEPVVEEEEIPEYMKEILKMKKLAEAQALGIEEEEIKDEKKPQKGKKEKKKAPKKKGKKEKQKMNWEQMEKARIAAELAAQKAIEEEKARQALELKLAKERDKREQNEQNLRVEQLQWSIQAINSILEQNYEVDLAEKEEQAWQQYLKCDGLPDPSNCAEMNTYLHLWEQVKDVTIDDASRRTSEVVKILEELDNFIYDPLDVTQEKIEDWKWIRSLFRSQQRFTLDDATYNLLRNVYKKLNRIDIPRADFHIKQNNYALNLFVMVQLPVPIFNPRKPANPRINLDFDNMSLIVEFPTSIDCIKMAIRSMYVSYDHLSDTCSTFYCPPVPEKYTADLLEAVLDEWYGKIKYRYDNRIIPPKPEKEVTEGEEGEEQSSPEPEPEPEITDPKDLPIVPYRKLDPTPSAYVISQEDEFYSQLRQSLVTNVPSNVINLRKYATLGGCYYLNLYYQPPQAKEMVSYETVLTVLQIPKTLYDVPFHIPYVPPPPLDPSLRKKQEQIEEEMKKQEEELDKLMFFTLTLPDHVMWLDVPIVCGWDEEKNAWTTDDIHDVKHIEEKGYITFRTGKFGCFSLALYKYVNLPYQTWEMKPELDGSVTFQLTAAILMLEFNITNNLICLTQLQNTPNNALQDIVGIRMKLSKLKRLMKAAGVDVFPEFDTFCYVEGTAEKHWPMEHHLYHQMARLSTAFNFAWSRWNLLAGRRKIVMQMREYKLDKPKQKPHNMLMVTPLSALYIDCTEVSPSFQETGVEGMKFYSDLCNLMRGTSTMATRTKVFNTNPEIVRSVADLLIAMRVLSFS